MDEAFKMGIERLQGKGSRNPFPGLTETILYVSGAAVLVLLGLWVEGLIRGDQTKPKK